MTSKLSWHSRSPSPLFDALRHAGVKVCKVFEYESDSDIITLKQIVPFVIYRKYFDANYDSISPAALVSQLPLNKLGGKGLTWEAVNEPVINTVAQAQALSAWYVEFARLMHAMGEHVAAYSFSTGNPPLELVPYLADGAAACDWIALHEYIHPGPTGPDYSQIGRYQDFLNALPPWARRQVLITETGCDSGGCRDCGWKGSNWNLAPDQYLALLKNIDLRYGNDDWLVAATIFEYGDGDWRSFGIESITPSISNYVASQGGGEIPPMPMTPQPPYATDPAPADEYLKSFPRPVGDNGRGLHFILDLSKNNVAGYMPYLKQFKCKWTTCYGGDENVTSYAAKQLLDQFGTFSILRIEAREGAPHSPGTWAGYVNVALNAGVVPYFQIFNEPEIEWPSGAAKFAYMWNVRAQAVLDAGGIPVLQVMSQEFFNAAVDGMSAAVKKRFVFAQHNYGANHPPEYPYNKGLTPMQDDTCVLRFLAIAEWAKAKLGYVMPILGGEGGYQWGNADDKSLPPLTAAQWNDWNYEMLDWFRSGQLPGPNGTRQPLPDYVFSITPWLLFASNWQSDSWIGGLFPDQKMPLLNKLTQDAPYVRQFGNVPPPPTPTVSFTLTPDTILVGQSAILKWDCDNVQAVYLNGVGVVGHDQRTIQGTSGGTQTFALRVIYPDNSEHIFPRTLTILETPPPPVGVELVYCPPDSPLQNYKFLTITQGVKAKVAKIVFYDNIPADDPASEGGVELRAVVKDSSEHQSSGEAVTQRWPDGSSTHYTRNGEAAFSMSGDSSFDPSKGESGPYVVEYQDAKVSGFGLPLRQHVEYLVKFTKE